MRWVCTGFLQSAMGATSWSHEAEKNIINFCFHGVLVTWLGAFSVQVKNIHLQSTCRAVLKKHRVRVGRKSSWACLCECWEREKLHKRTPWLSYLFIEMHWGWSACEVSTLHQLQPRISALFWVLWSFQWSRREDSSPLCAWGVGDVGAASRCGSVFSLWIGFRAVQ